jgi:hypothetical protein
MNAALLLLFAVTCCRAETWTYWIQPCTAQTAAESSCQPGDPELGRWALDAWQKASGTTVRFTASPEQNARLRLYWVTGKSKLYGEARPILVEGKRGAEVYVLPSVAREGDGDPLLREAVVYLTCLHESGHALGLAHTRNFDDIMYSFQFGGDIGEYFGRYRRRLKARGDIAGTPGLSDLDRERIVLQFSRATM